MTTFNASRSYFAGTVKEADLEGDGGSVENSLENFASNQGLAWNEAVSRSKILSRIFQGACISVLTRGKFHSPKVGSEQEGKHKNTLNI